MTDQTRPAGVGLDVRLAVTSDIVRAMLDGQPPDRIVQVAVEILHEYFPHLRSAYTTVAPDGRITVDRAAGPSGPAWPSGAGALALPGSAMEMLRARDLITTADTDIGTDIAIDALTDTGGHITSDVLRAGFAAVYKDARQT